MDYEKILTEDLESGISKDHIAETTLKERSMSDLRKYDWQVTDEIQDILEDGLYNGIHVSTLKRCFEDALKDALENFRRWDDL